MGILAARRQSLYQPCRSSISKNKALIVGCRALDLFLQNLTEALQLHWQRSRARQSRSPGRSDLVDQQWSGGGFSDQGEAHQMKWPCLSSSTSHLAFKGIPGISQIFE